MNAQGYRFFDDAEEALSTRDLSLLLPVTPPYLTPNAPAWRQRERRKAHFLRSLQSGEQVLPTFLSGIETELKTKARQLGWIDLNKRREG
jgi:hypothetical protein